METGQAQSFVRQPIQSRRRYLATKGADVRIPKVVGDDQQNIGLRCFDRRRFIQWHGFLSATDQGDNENQ
jgi:hypothetical protein